MLTFSKILVYFLFCWVNSVSHIHHAPHFSYFDNFCRSYMAPTTAPSPAWSFSEPKKNKFYSLNKLVPLCLDNASAQRVWGGGDATGNKTCGALICAEGTFTNTYTHTYTTGTHNGREGPEGKRWGKPTTGVELMDAQTVLAFDSKLLAFGLAWLKREE